MSLLLLTGVPGIGKTTAIQRTAERLKGFRLGGFTTGEMRQERMRVGFRIATFEGREEVFAHRELDTPLRIGGYGVDVAALDRAVERGFGPADFYLVDEIAMMECASEKFVAAVSALLESGRPVVATISLKGDGFVAEVKRRSGALLWTVTRQTRDALPDRIVEWAGLKKT